MATFEPLLWCRRGLNRSFKKLGTLPLGHKGLQQDTDQHQGFNKLCQTCCEVLAKFVLLSFDKSNYSENPCFPWHMFSPCCLVGTPWRQGRIAEASWPTPHHLPCEWGNLIHLVSCASQHKGHCSLREDHKKSGKLRNMVALRQGFAGRGVDMTGCWRERLGTWFCHPFHNQAQAGELSPENHDCSSALLIPITTPKQQQWAKWKAMPFACGWRYKKWLGVYF